MIKYYVTLTIICCASSAIADTKQEIEVTGFYGQESTTDALRSRFDYEEPKQEQPQSNLIISNPNIKSTPQRQVTDLHKDYNMPTEELNQCFTMAAKQYNIPKGILVSIASVESRFNANAINRNKNGTYDIGIMQINSSWFTKLSKMGITKESLNTPCQNITVGAWVLAENFKSYGHGWNAIQRYNGSDTQLKYARKVYKSILKYDPSLIQGYKQTELSGEAK